MKLFVNFGLIWLFFLALNFQLQAQSSLEGTVENTEGELLIGAQVSIKNSFLGTVTNMQGKFRINASLEGTQTLVISFIGYEPLEKEIEFSNAAIDLGVLQLSKKALMLDEFTVLGTRAGEETPMAFSKLDKQQIEKNNLGMDLPYLMEQMPSVVVTSDAGAGIGYTGIRIRGTDPTRINVTINGIPLNDAESQGVYWVNMPDFASSVDNIQVQRGVGTSSNGAAAFGASINLQTNTLQAKPYGIVSNSIGSFNSRKHTVQVGSGLIDGHWNFEGRLSHILSDGYVDRASSNLKSYCFSGAYMNEKTLIRVNVFSGKEITYQSWAGLPIQYIDTNRTHNPYTYKNEVDNYGQSHYQLHWNQSLSKLLTLNTSLHYTKGAGFYEQYKKDQTLSKYGIVSADSTITSSDLVRRLWLDNDFYGVVYGLHYNARGKWKMTFGGAWNRYVGDHFGQVIWARYAGNSETEHEYYRNNAEKLDGSTYLKINYQLGDLVNLFGDLQHRMVNYSFLGYNRQGENVTQTATMQFINPKFGASFRISEKQSAFASFAVGNREPNRDDFTQSSPESRPKAETLYDAELGYQLHTQHFFLSANAYYMYYLNQLVLTGAINDVGANTRVNVPNSYRSGIELQAGWQPIKKLEWNVNATFSQNKIAAFTEYVDNWDTWGQEIVEHKNSSIAFSPNIIGGSELAYQLFNLKNEKLEHALQAAWISKYVGKQYIDNTSNESRSLAAYWVNDLRLSYNLKSKFLREASLVFLLRNFMNSQYSSNAWVYRFNSPSYDPRADDPYTSLDQNTHYNMIGLYPQAGINYMLGLVLKF